MITQKISNHSHLYIYIIKKNLKKEASQEVVPVFIISIITHFITLGMRVKHRLVEGQ